MRQQVPYVFLLVAFCCNACGSDKGAAQTTQAQNGTPNAPDLAVRRDYAEKPGDVANPERGFFDAYAGGNVTTARSLVGYKIDLAANCNQTSLPDTQLAQLTADFAALRLAGIKSVIRFSYSATGALNACGYYDALSMDIVLGQVRQLGDIVSANKDVVAFIEMGFLGRWGEWSETGDSSGRTQDSNAPNLASDANNIQTLVDALLTSMPSDRKLLLRLPADRAALSNSPTDLARIGYHDDCFLANDTDDGTYPENQREVLQAQMHNQTLEVPMGGQTCAPDPNSSTNRFDCPEAVAEMEALRTTYLSEQMDPALADEWQTSVSPCYDFIGEKLGYRYIVQEVRYSAGPAQAGQTVSLQASIENIGFAPIYNERHAAVVLLDPNNVPVPLTLVDSQNDDMRNWLPGQTVVFSQAVSLPAKLPKGQYAYAIAMPDASGNPQYAVQFASQVIDNSQTFDSQRGLNQLYVNLNSAGAAE